MTTTTTLNGDGNDDDNEPAQRRDSEGATPEAPVGRLGGGSTDEIPMDPDHGSDINTQIRRPKRWPQDDSKMTVRRAPQDDSKILWNREHLMYKIKAHTLGLPGVVNTRRCLWEVPPTPAQNNTVPFARSLRHGRAGRRKLPAPKFSPQRQPQAFTTDPKMAICGTRRIGTPSQPRRSKLNAENTRTDNARTLTRRTLKIEI